jgi:U3 small nucleolar RNA-associated protein 13
VCTANAKGLVALHSLEDGSQVKHWASQHAGPVSEMALDPSEECLATGSADMSVRVWSMSGGFATHNFRGHKAVISTLRFHPSASKLGVLVSGDVSGAVCVWDLFKKSAQWCVAATGLAGER